MKMLIYSRILTDEEEAFLDAHPIACQFEEEDDWRVFEDKETILKWLYIEEASEGIVSDLLDIKTEDLQEYSTVADYVLAHDGRIFKLPTGRYAFVFG